MRMRWLRGLSLGLLLGGCGTDAHGVAECREIETIRCRAAVECGFPNEQECQRYQRDHCLHGTAPRAVEVVDLEGCRTALEAAQACAGDIGPDTLVDACSDPIEGASTAVPSACEVIVRPELAAACAFLVAEDPLDPEPEESESEEPAS